MTTRFADLAFLDEIRSAVANPADADRDLLVDVAAEYAEACAEANARLRQIGHLLNQGLRTEAIQLAERPPRILDLVAKLDFAELEDWLGILVNLDLKLPPRLDLPLAQELEHAYDEQRPLEQLLKTHRLLALSKAPLRQRIVVLRQIRQRDTANPVWSQDLETWERARLSQLRDEINRAERAEDDAALQEIVRELDQPWSIELVDEVRQHAQMTFARVRRSVARRQLETCRAALDAALAALDVDAGRAARNQWQALLEPAQLQPDEPLAQQASEALAWLEEEDQRDTAAGGFAAALAQLELALDQHLSLAKLNRCLYEVERFEREIPAALKARAYRQRAELETIARRRNRALLVVTLLFLLLAGGYLFAYFKQRAQDRQMADAARHMTTMIEQGQYAAAEAYYDKLPAPMQNSPAVVQLVHSAREQLAQQQAQKVRLRELIDQLQQAGVDPPRLDLVAEADSLATTPQEKSEVNQIRRAIEARHRELLQDRNKAFLAQVTGFVEALKRWEESENSTGLDAREATLQQLADEVEAFRELHHSRLGGPDGVDTPTLKQLEPVRSRIRSHLRAFASSRQRNIMVDNVTRSVGDTDAFVAALERLAEHRANEGYAVELRQSMGQADYWRMLAQWQEFARDQAWRDLARLDVTQGKKLLDELKRLKSEKGSLWFNGATDAVQDYLAELVQFTPRSEQEVRDNLRQFFSMRAMQRLYLVVGRQLGNVRQSYYTEAEPEVVSGGLMLNIDYLVDLRMLETKPARLMLKDVTYHGRAPQARIANQVLAKLDAAPAQPLDRLLLELILLIVKDQPSKELISDGNWQRNKEVVVDPLIKVTMLRAVLDQAVEYNLLFRQALGPLKTKVHDTYAWRADWIKHDDRDAKVRREDAKLLLEELTAKLRRSPALIEDEINRIRSLAQWRQETRYRAYGWLDRDDQGHWIVRTMESQDRDGKLFCLLPDLGVDPTWRMQLIGHVQGKQVQLIESTWFQAGRLVYLSRDAKRDKDPLTSNRSPWSLQVMHE